MYAKQKSKTIPLSLVLLLLGVLGCGSEPPLETSRATHSANEHSDDRGELCAQHGAPLNRCFICDP
jgi:hypothetical protein